jgi:hypothetical protein
VSGPGPASWPGLRIGPRETTVAANKAARICLSRKEAIDLALSLITAAQKVIADATFMHGDLLQLCDILITILSSYLWEHFRVSLKSSDRRHIVEGNWYETCRLGPGGIAALQGVGWGPEFRVVTRARPRRSLLTGSPPFMTRRAWQQS